MKSKTTTAILAFFLGGLGVHRFYLGQTGKGILCILFCWTLIPSLIAFIDFIIFLTMDDARFDAKYNPGMTQQSYTQNHFYGGSADELEKLHSLRERGIITDAEFQSKKAQMM